MTVETDRLAEDGVTKLLDLESSSRIQVLSAPIELPGVCGLCGTSRTDDRQFIDLGIWIEFYGQFYFCTFCMTEMVNRLGGLTPEQAEAQEEALNSARQEILDFQVERSAVHDAINSLRATGLFNDDTLNRVVVPDSFTAEQESQGIITSGAGDESESLTTTEKSTELITEQGSDDVSGSGSDEDPDSWLRI